MLKLEIATEANQIQAGQRILELMIEFQSTWAMGRMCDGVIEPWVPMVIYEIVFKKPLKSSFNPIETFGLLQQLMHSGDGLYINASVLGSPRVWLATPTPEERLSVESLKELRALATEHDVWVGLVDGAGGVASLKISSLAPGVLIPNPGEVATVTIDSFRKIADGIIANESGRDGDHMGVFHDLDQLPEAAIGAASAGATVDVTGAEDGACVTCGDQLFFDKSPNGARPDEGEPVELLHCRRCDVWIPTVEQTSSFDSMHFERRTALDAAWSKVIEAVSSRHP